MASDAQDELLKLFLSIAGESSGEVSGASEAAGGTHADAEGGTLGGGSVAATPAGTNAQGGIATNSNSTGSTLESAATTFLESGLGIVPLITGLMGLFGGSSPQEKPEKYQMPSSISFESGVAGDELVAADSDQTGTPRMFAQPASGSEPIADGGTGTGSSGAQSTTAGSAPQITVNVQAMDAQSFMDYSSQIAQAVRGAMLNLSSINDVVSEL